MTLDGLMLFFLFSCMYVLFRRIDLVTLISYGSSNLLLRRTRYVTGWLLLRKINKKTIQLAQV